MEYQILEKEPVELAVSSLEDVEKISTTVWL